MKQNSILVLAFILVSLCAFQATSAQFTIKIPKLPKTEKPKQEQPKTADNGKNQNDTIVTNPSSKLNSDNSYKNQRPTNVPVFLKDSVYVQARTHNEYWKMPNQRNYSSWIPMIKFNQFYNNDKQLNYTVEYFNSDGSLWFSENLEQFRGIIGAVPFSSSNPYERLNTKSTAATGIYSFKITSQDTKEVIYQGKFKVSKFSTGQRTDEKNKFDFFVEHDWLLPFGMITFDTENFELGGMLAAVSIWLKGPLKADELEGRIFYQGQQIKLAQDNIYKDKVIDFDERTTEFAAPFAPNNTWKRWQFYWYNFLLDNNGTFRRENFPDAFYFDKNPGEYTVKIYRNGAQIRELSFSVGADGKIVVPAYSTQITLPHNRVILPVKIIGAEKWDSLSWKTDAFYGNPLSGFNVP